MKVSRVVSGVAVATLVAGVGIGGAAPANAAELTIDCTTDDSAGAEVTYQVQVTPGEIITIYSTGCTAGGEFTSLVTGLTGPPDWSFLVDPSAAPGLYEGTCTTYPGDCFTSGWPIVLGTEPNPTSYIALLVVPASAADQTPPSVGQGLPLPASGSCSDVDAKDALFATDIEGGWTKSWEPWANPSGPEGDRWGWACIRTLVWTPDGWVAQLVQAA